MIARYRIIRRLKRSPGREIFLAERNGLTDRQPVVLKFQRVVGFDPSHHALRIAHPNVVRLLDAAALDEKQCLVLEYIQGTTLETLLKNARARTPGLTPQLGLYVIQQVLEGLEYAHSQHLCVHRELLPENVLIGLDGSVKLINLSAPGSYVPEQLESPCYFSPEQLQGARVTPASNTFSLAAMLVELLSHVPLFVGDTHAQIERSILNAQPTKLAAALALDAPHLVRVVERALRAEPGDRFQRPAHFAAALEQRPAQIDRRAAKRGLITLVRSIMQP